MKKISSYLALAAVALAFTACSDDTDPKATYPVNHDFLNIPVMAEQTIVLETAGNVDFTLSQPDYGVALVPSYALQISLDPSFEKLPSQMGAQIADLIYNRDAERAFYQLPNPANTARFAVKAKDIADGLSNMFGYDDIEQYKGREDKVYTGPLYCRVLSFLPTANPGTFDKYAILSNVVTLATVVGYPTVRQPGCIYLIGTPSGWVAPEEANAETLAPWALFEKKEAIDSKVYYGTFDIPADQFEFRFYSALTGWDKGDSWGPSANDEQVPIEFKDGKYSGAIQAKGKGKFYVAGWTGGWVKMVVDLGAKTASFEIVDGPEAE